MNAMFYSTKAFNQPIDKWDVSKVTDMGHMFRKSDAFNQPIDKWDVSNVKKMYSMFKDAFSCAASNCATPLQAHCLYLVPDASLTPPQR